MAASTTSTVCYCARSLTQRDRRRDAEWTCGCCCKKLNDRIKFWCIGEEQCIYYNTQGIPYYICSDCFNAADVETKCNDDDDEEAERTLVFNKTMSSINRISLEMHSKGTYRQKHGVWNFQKMRSRLNPPMTKHEGTWTLFMSICTETGS